MAGRVFISYRRADSSGHAGRLAEALKRRFAGHSVFIDVEEIKPGQTFEAAIERHLHDASALLVVIGPHWLEELEKRSREAEPDLLRREIAVGLAREILVIPVLVESTPMPRSAELPSDLRGLAQRSCVSLRNSGWKADVEIIAGQLRPLLPANLKHRAGWLTLPAVALAAIGTIVAGDDSAPEPDPRVSSARFVECSDGSFIDRRTGTQWSLQGRRQETSDSADRRVDQLNVGTATGWEVPSFFSVQELLNPVIPSPLQDVQRVWLSDIEERRLTLDLTSGTTAPSYGAADAATLAARKGARECPPR